MSGIIVRIRRELEGRGSAKIRASEQRFFREPIKTHGVRSAEVVLIGKKYFREIKSFSKKEIFALCEELFSSGYNDEARIACDWSYNLRANYVSADFKVFESWIDEYIDNWAKCDTFCNHTVGTLIEMYPNNVSRLKNWTRSKKRWLRRAAAVSLVVPAKRGQFLPDVFTLADILLADKEDMVQKGYGWLLKVAAEKHQEEVFAYVMRSKNQMPRVALRYAIEKMPADLRTQAMKK